MKTDWKTVRLGDVCEIAAGQGAPQGDSNYCDEGTPFVKAGNLIELIEGKSEKQIQKVSEEVAKSHKLKKYKASSILFAKSGMSCMKGYVYQLKNDCYVVSHLAIVKPKEDFSDYIEYCLRHIKPNTLVKDEAYPSISLQDISNLQIPLPPLETQKQIAVVLDKCTSLISKYKKMLEKYDTLIKSRFIEMFGDPVENPMGWEIANLDSLSDIVSGVTKGRKIKEAEVMEVPYMAVSNVKAGYIDWTKIKTIVATKAEIELYKLKINDVLMTEGGDPDKVGRGARLTEVPNNCIHQNHVFRVRLKDVCPVYFSQYLQHEKSKRYFFSCAKQTTGIASINITQLKNLPVVVPPIDLQNQFAAFVQQIDKSKFAVQKSLEKAETLYKSLMQEYFG